MGESYVLLWRRVPSALVQPRPLQAADWVLVLDGAFLGEVSWAERLERVVAEELTSDVILDVADGERAGAWSLFCGKSVLFWWCAVVGCSRRWFAGRKREWRVLEYCLIPHWWVFYKTSTRETRGLFVDLRRDSSHHRRLCKSKSRLCQQFMIWRLQRCERF